MKKLSLIFATSLCLTFLVGCGSTKNKLPKTKYEKVQYAFEGVENSLKNQKVSSRSLGLLPRSKRSETDAIGEIYSTFTSGTASEPDFKYDEPPMIQFQYIKSTLEKIGGGFDFGTKYQETITGSIYYDFTTGKDTQSAEFKQDYSMNFSLYINIDDSDLITCKVAFDINYVHDSDTHHQIMYAELFLDYDMSKTDANYTLKLNALDDASDYRRDEEKYFSAEYDYVNVSGDGIKEWRKIGYSTNTTIVIDSSHPSLSNYLSSNGIKFKPTIQLYKDGQRYQRNQLGDADAIKIATIACDDLGLNATDIKYKDYLAQASIAQPVLKTVYESFSRIYGKDLANNLVYTGAKEEEGGESNQQPRVHSSWPTDSLNGDGYNDVPGLSSLTATFSVERTLSTDGSYYYAITVNNSQDDDLNNYIRTLISQGFREEKIENNAYYLHVDQNGHIDYAVSIVREGGTIIIYIGKASDDTPKEDIVIQNGQNYTGDYSSYEEVTYTNESQIGSIVATMSGGRMDADIVAQYANYKASKSYKIYLDSSLVKDNFNEYVRLYSGWKVISDNSAFYTTINGLDILIMMDKDSSNGIIEIHSFVFSEGSIATLLNGGSHQGGDGENGGNSSGGGQIEQKVTVSLYEVDSKTGIPEFVESKEYNDGETIDLNEAFGPGKYYEDSGCIISLGDTVVAYDGLSIYRKVESQEVTQGSIVIYDANTKQELFTYTDIIGAQVEGGKLFDYVLYKDEGCQQMVGMKEEITISADPLTLYCQDYSKEDYVTLTVNTYINGILSPYQTREFGIRKGLIMNNYSSNSFPVYYSNASYYDSNFTMTLNGAALGNYTQDLIAFRENATLNINCVNDWCKVYHVNNSDGGFDFLWEGTLSEGDTFLHGARYYHVTNVEGETVTYDKTSVAYTYTLHSVFNGKIITTEKDYFALDSEGHGMSFYFSSPDDDFGLFYDIDLTNPIKPAEGEQELYFNNSYTLYQAFSNK